MKFLAIATLTLCVVPARAADPARPSGQARPVAVTSADKPAITHAMIEQMEGNLDRKLRGLWAEEPTPPEIVGLTQGVYLPGYGMVFMSEMNLAVAAGITPFHQKVTPDEIKRTHEMKAQRLAKLRDVMRDLLVDSAASLDTVPDNDQVAVGITLFYWKWENRTGMPSQIVMHAPKKLLLQAKTGAASKSAITADEF